MNREQKYFTRVAEIPECAGAYVAVELKLVIEKDALDLPVCADLVRHVRSEVERMSEQYPNEALDHITIFLRYGVVRADRGLAAQRQAKPP